MTDSSDFGAYLKQLRHTRGLTQEALAQRVACSVELIRKVEHGTRRLSGQVALRLADVLGIPSSAQARFVRLARGYEQELHLATVLEVGERPARGNLPSPVTTFIGREPEVAHLTSLLAHEAVRLVTLTGPGGVVKTQLALHVARAVQAAFPDGAWLVNLAPIRDADSVGAAIAQALGVSDSGADPLLTRLTTVLQRELLLVLDNLEHLLEARSLLSELLAACPRLRIMVTSRVRLQVYGEWELRVPALDVPEETQTFSSERAAASASVQLFVARARAAQHGFALSDANAAAVAAVCRHVGGLPLAIELAAAQVRRWSPSALLARLSPSLPWLVDGPHDQPGRLQSMHAALDWSYALLAPAQQTLFRGLGVFVGGWTSEAAAVICAEDTSARDLAFQLQALCEHQFVQLEQASAGPSRFTMLEVMREYALHQLGRHGEELAVRQRHAAYFCTLAERSEPHLRGTDQLAWIALLKQEYPNVRAALGWCFGPDGASATGVRLVAALEWFWWLRNQCHEGMGWLANARTLGPALAAKLWPRFLAATSLLALGTGDFAQGERWATEALAAADDGGDVHSAWAMALCGLHRAIQGEQEQSTGLIVEALQLAREQGDDWMTAAVYWCLASVDLNTAKCAMPLEDGLRLAEKVGDRWNVVGMRLIASWDRYANGDVEGAVALLETTVTVARSIDDRRMQIIVSRSLVRLLVLQGVLEQAMARAEASLQIGCEIGDRYGIALMVYELGHIRLRQGDMLAAQASFRESLERFRATGYQFGVAASLVGLARMEAPERAAVLLSGVSPVFAAPQATGDPFTEQDYEQTLAWSRSGLDPASFATAWREGQALSLDQAVELAVSNTRTKQHQVW